MSVDHPSCNPLYSDNRLKLGVFGANVSNGCAATTAPGHLVMNWPSSRDIVLTADRAGFEAIVPVARWRGFGGATNFNGTCYETLAWAAGMGALTQHAAVFCTTHVPTIHPIVAAKQCTTVDHLTGGRFALNVVCGWFAPELRMFGLHEMDHDTRYAYADEWVEIVRRLWTEEDEFDYEGKFFRIEKGFHEPKPLQRPHPPIMNAGSSGIGARFAAKHADMAFVAFYEESLDQSRAQLAEMRRIGREEFGRSFQIWTTCRVVCRPTEQEARRYEHYYINEMGDFGAVETILAGRAANEQHLTPELYRRMKARIVAGWGGYPLVGTAEQIVDRLIALSAAGIDGVVLSWVNYHDEMRQWVADIMPLIEQAGLRRAVTGERPAGPPHATA
ncbi:MAG TPA: LLM class flavin-dependent oxidoreductase [Stellaceae bacterium]|nr:LLM class flavin-dependent oxidoreductase [Stellaceae bacterium]